MSVYEVDKIQKYYDRDVEKDVPEVLRISLVTSDKESALKHRAYLMSIRDKEDKQNKISYVVKTIKDANKKDAYNAWYKQGLLEETIPNDLKYRFGDKAGDWLASSLVRQLYNESYEDCLYYWDVDKVITEEKFNESISTTSHVCSRATHIYAKVDINGKTFEFSAIDFHEAFRV